jgi:sortase A
MRRLGLFVALLACAIPATTAHASNTSRSSGNSHNSPSVQKSLGRLRIPALRVNEIIYEGVTDAQFDLGVGQLRGVPPLGTNGNIVIGGHRTSAKQPFLNIDRLKNGDEIFVHRNGKKFRYVVSKTFVVTKHALWILNPTANSTLTLFSCHPKGKTSHRYIIRATFVP